MGGITLARSEFLVLMDAVQAPGVVGLDALQLVPEDAAEHKALVSQGIEQLKERGALKIQDGVNVLDTTLIGMAMAIADPDLALITSRDTPGVGQQLFLHYKSHALVVEQTLPSDEEHRLALVGDAELIDRLMEILPVGQQEPEADMRLVLAQEKFIKVKDLAEAGEGSKALKMLQKEGVEATVAESLLTVLAEPEFGGTLAILRCEKAQVVDGRNLAVVQGTEGSWLVRQTDPGSDELEVAACSSQIVRSLLSDWIAELSGQGGG